MIKKITREEKDCIMYYQGGGKNVRLSAENQFLRGFYDAADSYMVMNALLMPGISNERARLKDEKKKFAFAIIEHMDELIKVYCNLYSAMCKYTAFYEYKPGNYTYRIDRMNTLEFLKQGQMFSFMSTSVDKEENSAFCNKDGILLLEIDGAADVEHVDVNAVLGEESKYPHENEILYAPFALVDRERMELTENEKKYRDMHGEAPKAKYLLRMKLSSIVEREGKMDSDELECLYEKIVDPDFLNVAKLVWETFMCGEEPDADMAERYTEWKDKLQIYIRLRFSAIKGKIMAEKRSCKNRLIQLENDINTYGCDSYENRQKYEKWVELFAVGTAVLYPLAALTLAFSYFDKLEPYLKAISLILTTMGAALPAIVKCLGWGEKLQQRTDTYLKLDELKMNLRYEKNIDEEILDKYISDFKEIIRKDNLIGLNNSAIVVKYLDNKSSETEPK